MRTERGERWVRAYVDGVAIVDTRSPLLFWDTLPFPSYAFDAGDVRTDLLTETEPPAESGFYGPHSPVGRYFDVATPVGTRRAAAWQLMAPEMEDMYVFSWQPGVIDRWMEEDEEVFGHPRDPYSRVDALTSSRHVVVRIDGDVVADSRDVVALFETGLPVRYYLPPTDVRLDALREVEHRTYCPYKGWADRYWNAPTVEHVAWLYREPYPAVGKIVDRIAFYNEFVDLEVDGVLQPRPESPFA